jgi:ribosome-associated translation inhibitor RaiA
MDLDFRTEKQYAYFKKQIKHYVKLFGMKDWKFMTVFSGLENSAMAAVSEIDANNRAVTIYLNVITTGSETEQFFREVALHEVIHIILSVSHQLGSNRFTSESEYLDAHEREVVHMTIAIRELEDQLEDQLKKSKEKIKELRKKIN